MRELLNESVLSRKSEMYAMIISIEADFISNFSDRLALTDIPQEIINKSNRVKEEPDQLLSVLRGLDIQAYIEICNANIVKLGVNADQKCFINVELIKIIPVRNAVMHPRPLGFFDYPMLKAVFVDIPHQLKCFSWNHIEMTCVQIAEHPETLLPPPESLKKSNSIIENLPSLVDYEETSFIGRKKEIGEIRAQLNRKNVSVLSIIGDGGVGKTATILKFLYDMLDDPNCHYELIIWTSLKTNELSDHDFSEIVYSIKTTAQMYEKLAPFVGGNSIENTKNFIIELAQNFSTLFVLDNLETINTADIKEFVDEFSEYGQVLVTSRIGLGEIEHRYKLGGLNDDDVLEYTDILLNLYGFECFITDERKKQIVIDELHSNPLAIKWFVRCLYNGQKEEEILAHKEDLINFCMANVYEKLSNNAHNVLDILTVAGIELSFPELMYYIEGNLSDCVKIKYAINELGKCNFINEEKFRRDNNIAVTEFAHEFLMLHFSDTRYLLARFKELEQKLIAFGQQLLINKSEDLFNIRSLQYKNKSELVAAFFLNKALIFSKTSGQTDSAFEIIKYAKEILPQYYESNLLLAHIYGPSSPLKAKSEYENAIKYCKCTDAKVRVHISFADFLIRLNDYPGAIDTLREVEMLDTGSVDIKLQKSKVLCYIGEYDKAEAILDKISSMPMSDNVQNKLLTRRADIQRRRCELIDIRETQKRLIRLKKAFSYLEQASNPDDKIYDYMTKILVELTYLYADDDALQFIIEMVQKYYQNIRNAARYREFKELVSDRLLQIRNEFFKKEVLRYILNYNDYLYLLKSNEALIYSLKQGYGFCKNNEFPQGLYFSMAGLPQDINYGDIIHYSGTITSKGRPSVVAARKIGNIDDRIIEKE